MLTFQHGYNFQIQPNYNTVSAFPADFETVSVVQYLHVSLDCPPPQGQHRHTSYERGCHSNLSDEALQNWGVGESAIFFLSRIFKLNAPPPKPDSLLLFCVVLSTETSVHGPHRPERTQQIARGNPYTQCTRTHYSNIRCCNHRCH